MTSKRSATDWRTLGLFAIASGVAVGLGSYGLGLYGADAATWSRNLFAWFAGLVLSVPFLLAGRSRRLMIGLVAITVVGLAASLLVPGQSGVHRWLDVGPLQINVAALLLPVALVALSTSNIAPAALLAAIGTIGAILVAQPDASQATAFLLAAAGILFRRTMPPTLRTLGVLAVGGLALAAWLRPDPLQPVPEVEGIFTLLAEVSSTLAAAGALAIASTCVMPLRRLSSGREGTRQAAIVLSVYFSATALLPFVGAFPVPLVGVGMSFPVGFWLAMALLSAHEPQTG